MCKCANAFAKNQTRLAYEDKRDLYCTSDRGGGGGGVRRLHPPPLESAHVQFIDAEAIANSQYVVTMA